MRSWLSVLKYGTKPQRDKAFFSIWMSLFLIVVLLLTLTGCAPTTNQTVLRNQPPNLALSRVVEVMVDYAMGFGAPIQGNRILTVHHITSGPKAYWRGQNQQGHMSLLRSYIDEGKDLALYKIDGDVFVETMFFSDEPPRLGEEVYWATHTQRRTIGLSRGWVVAVEKDTLLLDGWFHPGTSGTPILRSDGTVVGISSAGSNWSCQTVWTRFEDATLKDQLECLFRKSFFPAGAVAVRVDGWD